ncbi:adenosylmethionine--8-amino-7-oxononanoate transaminase [Salinispirillum sp. LH 10-3-1]|uniref:Adenosylmethionine-8-amino-7-oxononanoate aminotransferase n=1 Tax=Salinispirillum sp. LH 10-3-1 TaxID=2952525 RepID=A0AB38YCR6_9GAMM
MDAQDLEFDRRHLWHPYTSMVDPLPSYPVHAAQGVELELTDGRKLVDGMASWWCAIHGYGVPELNKAITDQLSRMSHVMFGGITHQPAVDLGRQLVKMTPEALNKVFLADSGSVSVEVALKMAIQYQQSIGTPRHRFVALSRGYHGDTTGAMSVCDPVGGMHSLFNGYLPENLFLPEPPQGFDTPLDAEYLQQCHRVLAAHQDELAALIVEPVVQGAGGMRFYNPEYLRHFRQWCDEFGILLIFDEIATGFGRTGKLFALEHANVVPDILCLGKAITGGYMTLAATMTTTSVAETISRGAAGVFMHGPTFMGNPLACAVANASLNLLEASHWQTKVRAIETQLRAELLPLKRLENVQDVRVLGAIGVVQCTETVDVKALQKRFVELGVWIRPFREVIYIMPPYVISPLQLSRLSSSIKEVLLRGV